MTNLWFKGVVRATRNDGIPFAVVDDDVWAILQNDLLFIHMSAHERPEHEADELPNLYGSLAVGIGHLLLDEGVGVRLPPELESWSTAPHVPASELGGWAPSLIMLGDNLHLAQSRPFGHLTVYVTTIENKHLALLVPSSSGVPRLEGHLDPPPVNYD